MRLQPIDWLIIIVYAVGVSTVPPARWNVARASLRAVREHGQGGVGVRRTSKTARTPSVTVRRRLGRLAQRPHRPLLPHRCAPPARTRPAHRGPRASL